MYLPVPWRSFAHLAVMAGGRQADWQVGVVKKLASDEKATRIEQNSSLSGIPRTDGEGNEGVAAIAGVLSSIFNEEIRHF